MAPVLKTGHPQGCAGSNPVLSAFRHPYSPAFATMPMGVDITMCQIPGSIPNISSLIGHIRGLVAQGLCSPATTLLRDDAIPYENRCGLEAIMLAEAGRLDEALAQADRILDVQMTCPDALFARVICLSMQQKWTPALAASNSLEEVTPDYPRAAWLRAGIFRQVYGDNDPAVIIAYNRAVADDGENLYARLERADIYRSNQMYAEARQEFATILEKCNGNEELRTEAQFKQACTEMVLGNPTAARNLLGYVLATAPDYPDAQDLFAMLDR